MESSSSNTCGSSSHKTVGPFSLAGHIGMKRTHPGAVLPTFSRLGLYLYAAETIHLSTGEHKELKIGWSFRVPSGYRAEIIPLPELKFGVHTGLDMELVEDLTIKVFNKDMMTTSIGKGAPVAQIVFHKINHFGAVEVPDL